jgi:glycerol-3-phosphate dehydrogenase
MTDIVIIGAGVVGCAIARQLSKYQLKIIVIEAQADVAMGSSGANSAIVHAGYDCETKSLMAELNVRGNELYDEWHNELEIPLKRIGSLVVAFDKEDIAHIEALYHQGIKNGVKAMKILNKEEVRCYEPMVNDDVIAALYAPSAGITCPYEVSIALLENAVINGVTTLFEQAVVGIEKKINNTFNVTTTKQTIETKQIINCAGIYADKISEMANAETYHIVPRKGEYCLFDKNSGHQVQHIIFQPPSEMGKGILVTPTVDENLLIGPSAVNIEDKEDNSSTIEGLSIIKKQAVRSVKTLNQRDIIRVFSGLRATIEKHDFIIEESIVQPNFIQAIGICSPGLSAAPAIAERVEVIIKEKQELIKKANYQPKRKAIPRFNELPEEKQVQLINKDKRYGKIVCRCETITEGEIVEAIHRPIPATTIDGIKRRTRAGMGRCQGGFCTPRIMEIVSRETKQSMGNITKNGKNSPIVIGKIKDGSHNE